MNYNNRAGIGRFGMGMKTAALSMSPIMELYSWQERGAYYSMILDVRAQPVAPGHVHDGARCAEAFDRVVIPVEEQFLLRSVAWKRHGPRKQLKDVGYNSTTSALCEHVDNVAQRRDERLGEEQGHASPFLQDAVHDGASALRGVLRPVEDGLRLVDGVGGIQHRLSPWFVAPDSAGAWTAGALRSP